uniref:Uncharacterized protein n=1 Tax=Sipha flava TaxID=143950 RepID=A0A2S2R367_9HEMI
MFSFLEKNSGLNFNCINFPTPLKQITKFEKINNVTVNVYSADDRGLIYPLRVSKNEKSDHFDLFFSSNEKSSHYSFIHNFSRLIRAQRTKHSSKLIICKRCFTTFSNKPNKNKPWGLLGLDRHQFMSSIVDVSMKISNLYKTNYGMIKLTKAEEIDYKNATTCHQYRASSRT